MTSQHLLKKLKQTWTNVLDIIQYGSSIQYGIEPKDIDIAVLCKEIPLKEQLNLQQEIKTFFEKQSAIPIHIKTFTLYSLFSEGNFAKQSIVLGISLYTHDFFMNKYGFQPTLKVTYSLKGLEKKDKVTFNYFLQHKNKGFLTISQGHIVSPGTIEFNPCYEKYFLEKVPSKISFDIQKNLMIQYQSQKSVMLLMDKKY
ncbi:MAG: hypothetical protein ACMXYK_03290 [Candidatus Woesearchaeota archaeon]